MAVPGSIDGVRYTDLRRLLLPKMTAFYQNVGEWDEIVKIRFPASERYDAVTVEIGKPDGKRKDVWRRYPGATWKIVRVERISAS